MGKLSRLRSMPRDEISYRVRERVRLETERFRSALQVASSARRIEGDCLPRLQRAFAGRFYPSAADRDSLRSYVRNEFPDWLDRAVDEADRLCEHRLELLGYGEVDLGPEINWHRDPVTGAAWPRHFWADYDPVNDLSHGDSKTIHELNRHQHLPRLAKAYFLTGEERYAEEAIAQLESWMEQNPESLGINWQSSLEIAIRVLSWLWTIFFLLPSPALTESFARRLTYSLLAQLRHVRAYPSVCNSPNTHLIGEATALFIAGLLLDGIGEANAWRDFGAGLLIQQAERQILDDGVHCELSTCYHCYTVDFYLQALILARRNHVEFPPTVSDRVAAMLEYILHMTRPDGSMPQLGDDDGGRALALHRPDYRAYLDGLSVGAALFERPDFKWVSGSFSEEAFWLLGEVGRRTYDDLPATRPSATSRVFPSAGYFVHRTGWSAHDSHAVFDCGGLGAPTGGHGHADALSVVFFAAGHELLIDPGTGVYNGNATWRGYFRSTAAHNTVVVDGKDQSEAAGTFQWATRASTPELSHRSFGSLDCVEGAQEGYTRLAAPVVHKRSLFFHESGYWLIADELRGCGEHVFDFHYHFAPEVEVRVSSSPDLIEVRATVKESGATFYLHTRAHTRAQASAEVIDGWVSRRYGHRERASVVRFRVTAVPPLLVWAAVMPFRKGGEPCAESLES
jgi:hypothetical protein